MKLAFVTVELYLEHKVGWKSVSEVFYCFMGKNSVQNCHLLSSLPLLLMINCYKEEQLVVFQKNYLCTCIGLSSYPPPS